MVTNQATPSVAVYNFGNLVVQLKPTYNEKQFSTGFSVVVTKRTASGTEEVDGEVDYRVFYNTDKQKTYANNGVPAIINSIIFDNDTKEGYITKSTSWAHCKDVIKAICSEIVYLERLKDSSVDSVLVKCHLNQFDRNFILQAMINNMFIFDGFFRNKETGVEDIHIAVVKKNVKFKEDHYVNRELEPNFVEVVFPGQNRHAPVVKDTVVGEAMQEALQKANAAV
jgi:hypothetical protein